MTDGIREDARCSAHQCGNVVIISVQEASKQMGQGGGNASASSNSRALRLWCIQVE